MSETKKAQRRILNLASIELTVFQLPDGSYRLSQSEVAGVIGKPARSTFAFLHSKRVQALLVTDFNVSLKEKLAVEDSIGLIVPIPLELAALYWQHWNHKGNAIATALVNALLKRSLNDLADEVFGVKTTKEERQLQLQADLSPESVARIAAALQQQLERQLDTKETERQLHQQLQIQMQQMMLLLQLLQLQLSQVQAQVQPQVTKQSTYIAIEHTGEFHRVSGVTHQQLRMELGILSTEEMNRLLESASVGFDSGYWQFAKAITPVLSHENYLKVKSLLVERLARRSEFH